jgi:hypothetical protein
MLAKSALSASLVALVSGDARRRRRGATAGPQRRHEMVPRGDGYVEERVGSTTPVVPARAEEGDARDRSGLPRH